MDCVLGEKRLVRSAYSVHACIRMKLSIVKRTFRIVLRLRGLEGLG